MTRPRGSQLRAPRQATRSTTPAEIREALGDADKLRALDHAKVAAAVRAEAVTELAFLLGRMRTPASLDEAASRVAVAQGLRGLTPTLQARLAHAEGYVLYQRGQEAAPVVALNRAAALYPRAHRLRPRVFDTLGQYFQHTAGDLDRARAYYERAFAEKQALVEGHGIEELWPDLAISSGNLGRLELTLERWAEAEKWTRIDLDLEQRHGAPSQPAGDPDVTDAQRTEGMRVRAMLYGQLARIALGRGREHAPEALRHLDHALEGVPKGSPTEVTLWFEAARAALAQGDRLTAERHVARADELAQGGGYDHLGAHVRHVRAQVLAHGVTHATDPRFSAACAELDEAMARFSAVHQPQDQCAVVRDKGTLLLTVGHLEEARRLIVERGIPLAERYLFGQLQPLARLESLLGEIDPAELAQLRQRRMRGGIQAEEHTGRLRGERRPITVWTCDIRGFAAYCDAHDDVEVVATLNRFFRTLGEPIIEAGGFIDKYVGDNILAYFPSAPAAAEVALGALARVAELNTEWEHLHHETLAIGIGIATGSAVVGTVGFAGKLEHTIIGSTVNLACRLVGVAGAGEIALDDATARALGKAWTLRRWGRSGTVPLKGFGRVKAWRLEGRGRAGRILRS